VDVNKRTSLHILNILTSGHIRVVMHLLWEWGREHECITTHIRLTLRVNQTDAILRSLFSTSNLPRDERILTTAGFELFDDQAAIFDQRTGLPPEFCRAIAGAVIEAGRLAPGDLILEIGPGTGQIGRWLGPPMRYVGIDKSAGMLVQFQARISGNAGERMLIRADANQVWPVADGVALAIFSSRAMHLLDPEHAASEIFRVASPRGATLVIGRVQRAQESVRSRMANEMNAGLRRHGYEGRRGEQRNRELFESLRHRGAQALEPLSVATWKLQTSPRQSLDSWRFLVGLGGIPVPAGTKERIMGEVEAWAESKFGGLDRTFESEEVYVLNSLRIPDRQSV
jgi:ubiquinone/menaquinone biosynthesis C-methylase UbiE